MNASLTPGTIGPDADTDEDGDDTDVSDGDGRDFTNSKRHKSEEGRDVESAANAHEKRKQIGQRLPADEKWPAWRAPPPELPTSADQQTLVSDQRYFDEFGSYLSETMFAAMKDVVSEIRVQDTLSRHVRRIPIQRLVAEPLVSTWFAKWIATVILKNRTLVGKTWHRVEIVQNIANQLDECRGFFRDPQRFGAPEDIYSTKKRVKRVVGDNPFEEPPNSNDSSSSSDSDSDNGSSQRIKRKK